MSIESLTEKWQPVLEHDELSSISDSHRRAVTAQLLENTEAALKEGNAWSVNSLLAEEPTNSVNAGQVNNYDPVLISLVRRSMPNLIAYDLAGVQPMTGPTGLIFAMRSKYAVDPANTATWTETFYNEVDTDFSGTGTHANNLGDGAETTGTGMATTAAEALGDGNGTDFNEMAFEIEKVSVEAKSRALKAEYTTELAQDLKAIHGLDAETELANILTSEILAEINREVVRTIYKNAKANVIAKETRRGKGNIILCSSDVASALQMAGVLDYTPALNSNNLQVDDTGNTFAGVLNGRYRVYIDPYAGANYMVVGYKGSSSFDAGLFYCPYVPLQMVRAVGENTFQPKIGFKTRYGMVANPYAQGLTKGSGALTNNTNVYYRRTAIANIL